MKVLEDNDCIDRINKNLLARNILYKAKREKLILRLYKKYHLRFTKATEDDLRSLFHLVLSRVLIHFEIYQKKKFKKPLNLKKYRAMGITYKGKTFDRYGSLYGYLVASLENGILNLKRDLECPVRKGIEIPFDINPEEGETSLKDMLPNEPKCSLVSIIKEIEDHMLGRIESFEDKVFAKNKIRFDICEVFREIYLLGSTNTTAYRIHKVPSHQQVLLGQFFRLCLEEVGKRYENPSELFLEEY